MSTPDKNDLKQNIQPSMCINKFESH